MDGLDDFLAEVRTKFEKAVEAENDNRERALDDVKFARLGQQWPDTVQKAREDEGRPCLVINRLPSFIRQVVNTARQNRPSINVIPADSGADTDTAEVMSGLIRNIEVSSDADVAYDTAVETAVTGGFGYIRVNTAYTSDDTFDQDIVIERIADPFTVYGDPEADSADGSDWNCAFIVKMISKDDFAAKYKGKDAVDWDGLGYSDLRAPWREGDSVMIAEYWKREEVERTIIALDTGAIVDLKEYQADPEKFGGMPVGEPRVAKSHKITQYVVSGAEVLETIEWPGKYIPIVPVYGDEVTIEGKRHFKSLITDAKDAQRELNYWRSAAAESVALAPQAPFVGPVGAFVTDVAKWSTANKKSHPYIEYDGPIPPQRQSPQMPPAAEIQQAMAASDDMKAIIGLYDPSLGGQGNETSGVAIRQRQRQGDIGTFHFIDNLTRSIRQVGRILIDLIPKVYSTARVLRVLGEDMEPQNVQVAPQEEQGMMQQGIARIYDLTAGKYDLIVKAGPSYASQREYAQAEIVEIIRAFPDSAPILGPMYLRNSDWPGADEAADKLEQGQGGGDPQQAQQAMAQMQQLAQENQQLKTQLQDKQAEHQLKAMELQIKNKEADIKASDVAAREREALLNAQVAVASAAQRSAAADNPYSGSA